MAPIITPNGAAMKSPIIGPWLVSLVKAMGAKKPTVKHNPPRIKAPPITATMALIFSPTTSFQANQAANNAQASEKTVLSHAGKLVVMVKIVLIKNRTVKNISKETIGLSM